jgi:hypothetical protein
MADGFVQVPADSVGKRIDTTEITRPDSSVVERQRMSIGDDTVTLGEILGTLQEIRDAITDLKFALLSAFK